MISIFRLKFVVVLFGFCLTFVAGLWLVYGMFVQSSNLRRLEAISRGSIQRMELAVDYAITAMGEVVAQGHSTCSQAGKIGLRKAIYAASNVKDIRLQSDGVTCWGLAGEAEGLDAVIAAAPTHPGSNPDYEYFAISTVTWTGLGIRWQHGDARNIVAVVSTHDLLFDQLPYELRDHGSLKLSLPDGVFAAFSGGAQSGAQSPTAAYSDISQRFPIRSEMRIDRAVLSGWNYDIDAQMLGLTIIFGLGFGYLAARGAVRPPTVLNEIDNAIANGEFRPFFQPIFNLETRDMVGFEMLARWIKPDGSMVPVASFIPLAENEGRIGAITRELLRVSGEQVGTLLLRDPNLKMTFNVTPDQFLADDFASSLLADAQSFGLPVASIVVEITERQPISDMNLATAVARRLMKAGIRIAIDDAGTGHNGLSSIHALNAQILKIDKYFVDGVMINRKSSGLIKMLVGLAKQFDMKIVAEGIENEQQIEALMQLGIHEGQGYVYSRPVPAAAILELAASLEAKRKGAAAQPLLKTG